MIILISGKQGAGKTTLANALVKKLNEEPQQRASHLTFADPLYQMHNFCWGYLKDHGIEMPFVKDGYLLQMLGTEWGRNRVDPDIWMKLMLARIEKLKTTIHYAYAKNYFVVSDCRFKNEFAVPGALRIRLSADKEVRKERVEMWRETEEHQSETDLDVADQMGLFDLYFNTEAMPVDAIVDLVLHEIRGRDEKKESSASSASEGHPDS